MSHCRFLLVLAIVSMIVPGGSSGAQEGSRKTVQTTADTWVDSGAPSASHPDTRELVARYEDGKGSRIFLRFDARDLGKEVRSARLVLNLKSASGAEKPLIVVQGISSAWTERVTWANQPDLTRAYAAIELEPKPGSVEIDVTMLVQEALDKKFSFFGVSVAGPTAGAPYTYSRLFTSSEVSGEGPKLILERTAATRSDESEKDGGGAADALPIVIVLATAVALGGGLGISRWRASLKTKES